ncbi:MAG: hypothetical protein KKA79_04730 [Nanoarchaeota archaeon]|nr:hypothetical protein [Nanoarchaeota archaeon]MCG2717365.1 hypothetical protein [Nanoarchaeota archaeon]
MKLGGNIELEGFDNMEPAQLIVVKKIVGSSAKKISEEISEFDNLLITLKDNENDKVTLSGKIKMGDKEEECEASDKNLFFALNQVFTELTAKLK